MIRTVVYPHARLTRGGVNRALSRRHLAGPPPYASSAPSSPLLHQYPYCRYFSASPQPPPRSSSPKLKTFFASERRRFHFFLTLPSALLLLYFTLTDDSSFSSSAAKPLNSATFTPFTILAREQVSPTTFLLTVAPARPGHVQPTAETVRRAWEHGLWSVEVKQPQLQVAREYTPLPPSLSPSPSPGPGPSGAVRSGEEGAGGAEGEGEEGDWGGGRMRFLIRKMDRGEVSSYLARLKVGDVVELRGPRLGFDVRARAGVAGASAGSDQGEASTSSWAGVEDGSRESEEKKKVVFFAGGTGIAPALQAARALFSVPHRRSEGVEMEVVWANRRREDCEKDGAVIAMLEELRRKSGGRFSYSCTVDEEGSYIDAGRIARTTGVSRAHSSGGGLWSFGSGGHIQDSGQVSTTVISNACRYHSVEKLVGSDDNDSPVGTDGERCECRDESGKPVAGGKNLLMFSGPDGFISYYTGAKVWWGGKELQGPVSGVVGELKRRYPSLAKDWLVLKM